MIVNGFTSKAAALRHLRNAGYPMAGLLSAPESNPKVAKNGKLGILASPLHLAPARVSGFEVCPQRSEGCTAICLHYAGNPAYMGNKAKSRAIKTQAYFNERAAFMALVIFEIAALEAKAHKAGMVPAVRPNATSDIPWERVPVTIDGVRYASMMEAFPNVQFYDYTKVTKRMLASLERGERWPTNYHLTFSRTEANEDDCVKVTMRGGTVAAVFTSAKAKACIAEGWAPVAEGLLLPCVDGDAHDYRPDDPKGTVIVLKAKGKAKADTTGFVIR